MSYLRLLSAVEQVAEYLRGELLRGRWRGVMPGEDRLAMELGVGRKTAEAALRHLEHEGLLVGQGARRRRLIKLPDSASAMRPLRVAILLGDAADRKLDYVVELQHELVQAGHVVSFAPKSMVDLEMDVNRISRMVQRTGADAWVVVSGSREVLEWFAAGPVPAFALFGRRRGVAIAAAGPNKIPVTIAITRELIGLGHRRIVLLARPRRRQPEPGAVERAFLAELEAHGIPIGPYNLPDWEEKIGGFQKLLDSLFRVTPPTAMMIDEAPFFAATLQFLARRGLKVPEDVSLVCTDPDPTFAWCIPSIAHIHWEGRPLVRRIVRWAADISRGKKDLRQTLTPAKFIRGGTVGPARG